jgi:hypothetical protein
MAGPTWTPGKTAGIASRENTTEVEISMVDHDDRTRTDLSRVRSASGPQPIRWILVPLAALIGVVVIITIDLLWNNDEPLHAVGEPIQRPNPALPDTTLPNRAQPNELIQGDAPPKAASRGGLGPSAPSPDNLAPSAEDHGNSAPGDVVNGDVAPSGSTLRDLVPTGGPSEGSAPAEGPPHDTASPDGESTAPSAAEQTSPQGRTGAGPTLGALLGDFHRIDDPVAAARLKPEIDRLSLEQSTLGTDPEYLARIAATHQKVRTALEKKP